MSEPLELEQVAGDGKLRVVAHAGRCGRHTRARGRCEISCTSGTTASRTWAKKASYDSALIPRSYWSRQTS